jgi:hypothetical protein
MAKCVFSRLSFDFYEARQPGQQCHGESNAAQTKKQNADPSLRSG